MTLCTGTGRCTSHHGEILQGSFSEGDERIRGLVTLPCPLFETSAEFHPALRSPLRIEPAADDWSKSLRAARITLRGLGLPDCGGTLTLRRAAPISQGFGSSTCDVVAVIRAIASSVGRSLGAREIARIAVEAESAADPTMFEGSAILFGQRSGHLLDVYDEPLPPLSMLGFAASAQTHIDTISLPLPVYSASQLDWFDSARTELRAAIAARDLSSIGAIATHSALINQSYLPKLKFDSILEVAADCDALGVQVAHSGSLVGVMFDAHDEDHRDKLARAIDSLRGLGFRHFHQFNSADAQLRKSCPSQTRWTEPM
jgi:uncharacterized protein involved in propanediol utilization